MNNIAEIKNAMSINTKPSKHLNKPAQHKPPSKNHKKLFASLFTIVISSFILRRH